MSDQVELRQEAEAVDVLTCMTSSELSEFSREHNVAGYSGLTKREKAQNIVRQAPEAALEYLEADEIVAVTEDLREDLGGVDSLRQAAEMASSKKLARRLNALDDALLAAPHGYEATKLEFQEGDLGWTTVRIEAPNHHWTNEGETHTTRVYVVLGPRGGLKTGTERDQFSGWETDHAEGRGWRGVLDAVRGADG